MHVACLEEANMITSQRDTGKWVGLAEVQGRRGGVKMTNDRRPGGDEELSELYMCSVKMVSISLSHPGQDSVSES